MKSGAGAPSVTTGASSRRAIGIVRVSRLGDDAVSPDEQRERIASTCERDGLELVDTFEELDVSGGAPLAKRPGLGRAVEMVEHGQADVVVVAYFDRLVRSLAVQAEVVDRVERAGGAILAVDVGQVTNGSAGQWLSGTMLGAVSEYHRRVTAERTQDAKRRAIADGRPTFDRIPPGQRQREDKRLEPHPDEATVVRDAFELRASGATVREVRGFLREHGIERSYHGVQAMLGSRMYLGELRFGELVNIDSHPAIVDAATWQKVQRMRAPRGRAPEVGTAARAPRRASLRDVRRTARRRVPDKGNAAVGPSTAARRSATVRGGWRSRPRSPSRRRRGGPRISRGSERKRDGRGRRRRKPSARSSTPSTNSTRRSGRSPGSRT